jgi:crossover junction endodeoxyribonuclease RuvC
MLVLGIDPGLATVGYAIVKGSKEKPICLDFGVLTTDFSEDVTLTDRLLEIAGDLESIIQTHRPQRAVVEELFFFKNQKTAITVAQSRGVVLYLLAKYNIPVMHVTPLQVKQTLCGYGKASKQQIQTRVQKLFNLANLPKPDDAADSLAIAWWGL